MDLKEANFSLPGFSDNFNFHEIYHGQSNEFGDKNQPDKIPGEEANMLIVVGKALKKLYVFK
jgi:hypothetical protein